MSLVAVLQAEEQSLMSELRETPLFQKIEAIRKVMALYQSVAAAPAHVPVYAYAAPAAPAVALDTSASVATVVVNLPTDAKLFVDGERVPMSSSTRSFRTPQLQAGRDYFYTMKVETVRNGETVEKSTRVIVRAGETARADFGETSLVAVQSRPAASDVVVERPAVGAASAMSLAST